MELFYNIVINVEGKLWIIRKNADNFKPLEKDLQTSLVQIAPGGPIPEDEINDADEAEVEETVEADADATEAAETEDVETAE